MKVNLCGVCGKEVPIEHTQMMKMEDDNTLRKMTPTELFRLQGIREDYIDKMVNSGLSHSALYERAGRTVFIPIVKRIAERITANMPI